ncbi:MAG: signal peptidase II [Aquificota bacterium]|jgi:signal peptidase II|nr:signal peptidase II [Aquificaceae bacterium]MDM7267101.1 signal peptidase II [Aquificaceae bacterium]HAV39724.1 signal peptidase II [Aquificaceae bacterium]
MAKGLRKHALIYIAVATLVLFLDLFTKRMAEVYLAERDISLLPFLHLVLIYNKGVAFGLLSNAPDFLRIPLLLITPLLALVITFLYTIRSKNTFVSILMGMVGGGALGNLYDRAFLGRVRDFIYLSYGGLSWPAFNLADASISIAIVLLLLRGFFLRDKNK